MGDDISKNIRIKYSVDGIESITSKVRQFDVANKQMITTVKGFNTTTGVWDKQSKSINQVSSSSSVLSGHMAGLALRFVGYNLILNQVMGAQQKLINFVNESVSSYREFQVRIAEIASIIESSQLPMMDNLSLGVQELSKMYGQSTSDMAKGLYEIISAAFDAKDSLNLLNTATKASIAGLTDVRTSVNTFTSVLNAYGMSAEQATHVSDVLFQSVVRGKFEFQDLESALGYVVPMAAQSGIALEELMAALSSVTRQGIHLDMAARGISQAIQNIISPSEGAAKAADKYGIEMNGLALQVMGLKGWFDQLNLATHEYGTKILSELIPNMRSLRVAMVLAGDEGLAGFGEDLQLLAKMGDRTKSAFKNIAETSQFASNQITQQFEEVKRKVGADWDELVLGIQQGILNITKIVTGATYEPQQFKAFVVSDEDMENLDTYVNVSDKINENLERRKDLQKEIKAYTPDEEFLSGHVKVYPKGKSIKEIEALQTEFDELGTEIQALISIQSELQNSTNNVIGDFQNSLDTLGNYKISLNDIQNSIDEFHEKLKTPKIYGWGNSIKEASVNLNEFIYLTNEQSKAISNLGGTISGTLAYEYELLKADQMYADANHDINMGLKELNYNYKVIPDEIQNAIDAVRDFTRAQDENRKSNERLTAAMRILEIETLQIQLMGMMRRRGLTRNEEKRLKQIEIKRAQMRLENMKSEKEETEASVFNYQEKEKIIDNYLSKLQEEQYVVKYNYDQQLIDLENLIGNEAIKLQTRYNWWELTNLKIIDLSTDLINDLGVLFEHPKFLDFLDEYGIKIDEIIEKTKQLGIQASIDKNKYTPTTSITATDSYNAATSYIEAKKATTTGNIIPLVSRLSSIVPTIMKNMLPSRQRGTEYIGETAPYLVHKGESISPSGKETGGGITNINIVNHNTIDNKVDAKEFAALQAEAIASKTSNRKGKTNFRMR
jgi:TP901 family phage tail tape measure protein